MVFRQPTGVEVLLIFFYTIERGEDNDGRYCHL